MLVTRIIDDMPLGPMILAATEQGLSFAEFTDRRSFDKIVGRVERMTGQQCTEGHLPVMDTTEEQLREYFAGTRQVFDLPLYLAGSPFQVKVWEALLEIPYGITRSYKQQAIVVGDLAAIRAVASANGQNGLAIIVPCHRVIGSDGSLTGYGGGLDRKKWLLEHEQKYSGGGRQTELF